MALVFRSVVALECSEPTALLTQLFTSWGRYKVRAGEFAVLPDGERQTFEGGFEAAANTYALDGGTVFRGWLFEQRDAEQVRTAVTGLSTDVGCWAWVDVERWAEDAFGQVWTPFAPRLLRDVLRSASCSRGPTGLDDDFHILKADQGALLADQVLDPLREVPLVVVSATSAEISDGLDIAIERAGALHRRLAGIAPIYVLGEGAVTAFSRAMLRAGDRMDVYHGAIRTYLPGAGDVGDTSVRHRFVVDRRLTGMTPAIAASVVAGPILRAAAHQQPPQAWVEVRQQIGTSESPADAVWSGLVEVAETELNDAIADLATAQGRIDELEAGIEEERETQAQLLAEREDLIRRVRFLEEQARIRGDSTAPGDIEQPVVLDFCIDVVEHVTEHFGRLVVGSRVTEGASSLDEHAQSAWARKALRAFAALQAFAVAQAEGSHGGSFHDFCANASVTDECIPLKWIVLRESDTTSNNPKFREQRTFEVDKACDPSGRVYMEAHIRLDNTPPAPRIHFYDDTRGASGKIYVGWFGPHLDAKSTN
jgi:hypothetical protein